MLAIILSVISLCVLVAEFWMGIVVIGWQGDRLYAERSKNPGQYWMFMSLHTIGGIGLPTVAFVAGI